MRRRYGMFDKYKHRTFPSESCRPLRFTEALSSQSSTSAPSRRKKTLASNDRRSQKLAIMGGKWRNCLGLLLTLVHLSYQLSENDYYTGAVLEYEAKHVGHDADATMQKNVDVFIKHMKEANKQGVDIIVFPEYGVTSLGMPFIGDAAPWSTVITSAQEKYVPCTGHRNDVNKFMRQLSCAAKEYHMYVVVNVVEREPCAKEDRKCPYSGVHYYNSNAVFDRNGQIIARYRKTNLFMEDILMDVTDEPEVITFDTDFGVKFGTFICFDILFPTPALNLTRIQGVKNFVYPVAWGSEIPFLTAPQVHHGWAFSENVNLLASGHHKVMGASSGSGIYLGRQRMGGVTYADVPNEKLVVARIPKIPQPLPKPEIDGKDRQQISWKRAEKAPLPFPLNISGLEKADIPYNTQRRREMIQGLNMQWDYISAFASVPLSGSMKDTICYESFCCNFNIETASAQPLPHYRAVVYQGKRMYGEQFVGGIRTCGMVQCANDSILSCGSIDNSNTLFTKMEITTTINDYPEILAFPTTMNSTLYPFDYNWTYNVDRNGKDTTLTLSLDSPMDNIVAFGLYMRNFKQDQWINLYH